MNELWSVIPLGTVPQRVRASVPLSAPKTAVPAAPAPARSAAPAPRGAPAGPVVPVPRPGSAPPPGALDAPTVAVDEDPTNRLSARLLAARAVVPLPALPTPARRPLPRVPSPTAPPPTQTPPPRPVRPTLVSRPAPPPTTGQARDLLPFFALAALLLVSTAVLVPWPGSGPWVASTPVGLTLLAVLALLTVPTTVDLMAGRDRASTMLLSPPLLAGAAAGTVAAHGTLPRVLDEQGLGVDRAVTAGAVAVALLACLLIGIVGTARRPRPAGTVGAPAIVVGISAGVTVAAVSVIVILLGGPALPTATVTTAAGGSPTVPGPAPTPATIHRAGTACPAEAAATLPEVAIAAPVVAHDSRVHIAICQGASGALFYYGADDRTHLTITLPATRSEDSWIASNNGVTYFITPEKLMITKGGGTLADEALTSGWTR